MGAMSISRPMQIVAGVALIGFFLYSLIYTGKWIAAVLIVFVVGGLQLLRFYLWKKKYGADQQ